MFIKLDRVDVYSITNTNGNDKPTGDIYINTKDISHIDGNFVIVGDYVFYCSDAGLNKMLSVIKVIKTHEYDPDAELHRLFELRDWFRKEFCKEDEESGSTDL